MRLALCRFSALGLRPQARRQFAPAIHTRARSLLLTTAPQVSVQKREGAGLRQPPDRNWKDAAIWASPSRRIPA